MRAGPGGRPFPRETLAGGTLDVAGSVLGARLVRDPDPCADRRDPVGRRVGRIVEVEAYVGLGDRASHARMGPTPRNRVMFGPPGIAYVYLVYGMHHCLNIVTEGPGMPAALLVRAIEPLEGLDVMRTARRSASITDARLAAGPGLVGAALGIDRSWTGTDLCDPASPLRLEARPEDEPAPLVITGRRVGISYAGEPWTSLPWRFGVAGSPALSRRFA